MGDHVLAIALMGIPSEIRDVIVRWISVVVAALSTDWRFAYESKKNKPMNEQKAPLATISEANRIMTLVAYLGG